MKKYLKVLSIVLALIMLLINITGCKSKEKDNIDLTIDNKESTVTNSSQVISGTFSSESNIKFITYKIATEVDDYEITDSGNATINDNTYSVDVQLKPQINKITVTASTESGKTESKTVNITYDSGTIYELDENHVAYDSETDTKYIDNIILIYFNSGVSDDKRNEIVSSIGGKVVGCINGVNQWQVEISATDLKGLEEICTTVESMDGVYAAEIDRVVKYKINSITNDPWENSNGGDWYLEAIEAYSAWDYNDRFSDIDIGIVDNGFDVWHEDLHLRHLNSSENSIENHGTQVSGIIGATDNNGKGMTGLVWNSTLWCVDWQPTEEQEWNEENKILSGFVYTVEMGAKIVNFSMGQSYDYIDDITDCSDSAEHASKVMVELLTEGKDFIVVQSSGNGTDKDGYAFDSIYNGLFASITEDEITIPENSNLTKQDVLDRIIIVGAAKKNDDGNYQQDIYSNGGSQVDICAPGTNIYSTIVDGYGCDSGTSLAAPMVTGVCGLVWSVNSDFTGAQVKNIVCNSYDENIWVWDNPDGKHITNDNYRMVNAKLAVEEAIRRTDSKKGTINGTVKDSTTNSPIQDVTVEVIDNSTDNFETIATTTTDQNGTFSINLPYGEYSISFNHDDYNYYGTSIDVDSDNVIFTEEILLNRIDENTFDESIWQEFLSSEGYLEYLYDETGIDYDYTSLEYAIKDINSDFIPECIIVIRIDALGFCYNLIFTMEDNNILMIDKSYAFGKIIYSSSYKVIGVKPSRPTRRDGGAIFFYGLEGTSLEYMFEICARPVSDDDLDNTIYEYYDTEGNSTVISENEYSAYLEDSLVWKSVDEFNEENKTYKQILNQYQTNCQSIHVQNDDGCLICKYAICDIDNNGINELIIEEGTCEQDKTQHIYTNQDNQVIYLGKYNAWHLGLYYENENVIGIQVAPGDSLITTVYDFNVTNNSVSLEKVKEIIDGNFDSNITLITFYSLNNIDNSNLI